MEIELETVCGFSPFCRIFKKYLHVPEGEGGGVTNESIIKY